jgi:hypothetical protein
VARQSGNPSAIQAISPRPLTWPAAFKILQKSCNAALTFDAAAKPCRMSAPHTPKLVSLKNKEK